MQAQGRRRPDGGVDESSGERSSSTPRGNRSQPKASASSGTAPSASRSGSQPKQRSGGNNSNNSSGNNATKSRSAASGNASKPVVDRSSMVTPFEAAIAKMKKAVAGKSDDQLELMLQQLLQRAQLDEAAYLIACVPYLEAKYKTSDVIRLMLDMRQFEKAAQLIRDMKLQSNQLLVTLFIKELIRASLFQSAVRYAQEMVQNFGKKDFDTRDQARPSWTPQALVQSMIRARQFRTALRYAKQFDLLEMFPPAQLIAGMFEARSWDDAVSSVLEYRLFAEFPLESVVAKMLENRQWSNALKCINKLPSKELIDKYCEALVREAARVGDFVSSLRYLREFKLDQPGTHGALLQFFVDCLIGYAEFYKAIKYSIKFGLSEPSSDQEETGETSVYDTEVLIRRAIECGQYHVASATIKKLKLKDKFAAELEFIQRQQETMAHEFREFMRLRDAQYMQPQVQQQLSALLASKQHDELVDQVVEVDVVVSEEEEIIPRKPRQPSAEELTAPSGEIEDGVARIAIVPPPVTESQKESDLGAEEVPPARQSRFSFARSANATPPPPAPPVPSVRAPPPGLTRPSDIPAPPSVPTSPPSPPDFNFAQFAATIQHSSVDGAPQLPPSQPRQQPLQQQQQHQLNHLFPAQSTNLATSSSRQGPFYPPPPQHFNGHHGQQPHPQGMFGSQPPPPPMPMYYQQSSQLGFGPQPPNGSAPPPPMPGQMNRSNGPPSSSGFDISSLAMQFHARPPPPGPGFGNAFGMPGGPRPYGQPSPAPPLPPGMPAGLFPRMAPPMQQIPPPPPPPPQFSFKPTVSYTTVSASRPKTNFQ